MRLLLDNSVSWRVGRDLRGAGHDVVHLGQLGLASAPDTTVYERSVSEGRMLVTQDSDFLSIHASAPARTGVVLLRLSDGRPRVQAAVLELNLQTVEDALGRGAFVTVEDTVLRVRGGEDRAD